MNEVVIYRCPICGKEYRAEKTTLGIFPNEIHCHECEGTETVIYIEPIQGVCDYQLIKPTWNDKTKYRRTEANWYKRYGFSEWEIDRLFEYEEQAIKEGSLILIRK